MELTLKTKYLMEQKSNRFSSAMKITIDSREDISGIGKILADQYKLDVIRKHLISGDIIINNQIIIERKTVRDFVQSLIDGRLFRQVRQMKNTYQNCVLLIEGGNFSMVLNNCHPHAIKGALVSLILTWGIPVLFSENSEDSALLIWLMTRQIISLTRPISVRPGRRPKPLYKKQLYLLQGLPGVGITLAMRLLNHFGNIQRIMQASAQDMRKVKGLGKKKSEGIKIFIEKTAVKD